MKLNWAERWVVNNFVRVFEQRLLIRRLKKMFPLPPGAAILEIGCGRGAGALMIHKEFKPAFLHAMDLDIDMIRRAGRYLPAAHKRAISFFAADVLHLPCRNDSLDAVFGFGVLHHIPDWRSSVGEIARVLKPHGAYYLEELYPSLYQNFITRRLLLHPEEDRFYGSELKASLNQFNLFQQDALEIRKIGMLGVFIKKAA